MNEPRLRFKADDESQFPDWEEKKFANLYRKNVEKNVNLEFDYSKTISIASMQFNEKGNGASEDSLSSYKVLRLGDIAFEGHENKEYSHGRFVLNDIGDGIMSPRFSCMRPVCTQVDGFWKYYIHSERVMKNILVRSTKKGTMMHELVIPDFLKQSIMVPSLPEQQKIAEFLSTIDTVIKKQKETVSVWEERKKGVMQKLFRQEVRFKADDGSNFPEWEEKKLSEMFKKVIEKNRLDLPPLTIVQGYGTIRRDESERRIAYDEKGLKNYKAVQKDDFIVHLRSFEGGLEIANQDGIVSPAYHVYRGNDEVHPSFYYPYFRSSSFIKGKLSICVTGVRDGKNIEMGSFDELLIPHPCLAEQQKIADCLSSFDEVIEKQKATLAAWEELKKGLLQQMFV